MQSNTLRNEHPDDSEDVIEWKQRNKRRNHVAFYWASQTVEERTNIIDRKIELIGQLRGYRDVQRSPPYTFVEP